VQQIDRIVEAVEETLKGRVKTLRSKIIRNNSFRTILNRWGEITPDADRILVHATHFIFISSRLEMEFGNKLATGSSSSAPLDFSYIAY
jgi:hypothetical protein